jgi:hypothetical protein
MKRYERWPALPLSEWQETYTTLHMWTQIVGKVRMALSPPLNHWWHTTLYVSSRGLTTGPVPYPHGVFDVHFDFQNHSLNISTSTGMTLSRQLRPEPVADFHAAVLDALSGLGISVAINPRPQEIADPVPFHEDVKNCSYDPEYAHRFWTILVSTAKVMQEFRSRFVGKCSPVHFFWGSFDLACTRFSGRAAPARKGVISGPAYSHEVCSAGFWPGAGFGAPAYYSYTIPQPPGLDQQPVMPSAAAWNKQLSEFVLTYDDVRNASSPEQALHDFLESTYDAGARVGKWDRAVLEV